MVTRNRAYTAAREREKGLALQLFEPRIASKLYAEPQPDRLDALPVSRSGLE